jgi:hypothetical protein
MCFFTTWFYFPTFWKIVENLFNYSNYKLCKRRFPWPKKSAKISWLKTQRHYPGKIKLTKVNCPARSNCLSLVYYLDAQQAVESVLCAGYHTCRFNRTIKFILKILSAILNDWRIGITSKLKVLIPSSW